MLNSNSQHKQMYDIAEEKSEWMHVIEMHPGYVHLLRIVFFISFYIRSFHTKTIKKRGKLNKKI